MPMPTPNGENPQFYGQLKTPKTKRLCAKSLQRQRVLSAWIPGSLTLEFRVACHLKAVHLELVSDLTTEAFIAVLHHFIARCGCPALIWSDHRKKERKKVRR